MVVAAFSRFREFRADAGGARLAGRESMVQALQALQRNTQIEDEAPPAIAAFRIYNGQGIARFFASHPPLEERIERLRSAALMIEVVLDAALAGAGDHDDLFDTRSHGLLDDVLDDRLIEEREHLLWDSLGGGKEAGAEAGGEYDSFADLQGDALAPFG